MQNEKWKLASLKELEVFIDDITPNDVTIVIPTLNEEEAIGKVIEEITLKGFEKILVVDGKSNDQTVQIVKNIGVPVVFQKGVGKTGAIKTALEYVKTPFLVIIDGDYTYSPENIYDVIEPLKYFDQVIGARTTGRENISSLNRFGNWAINQTFNIFFGTDLKDVCSGLYGLRTSYAQRLTLKTTGFDVEVEIASQTASFGKIIEVPIDYRERLGVQKLSPLSDGFKIITALLGYGLKYSSVIFISGLFSLIQVPAMALLLYTAVEWVSFRIYHEGLALLGTLMYLLGFQSMMLAIYSVQQRRAVQEVTGSIAQLRLRKRM